MGEQSSKYADICAGVLLVAFFLPWLQILGEGASAYDLTRLGSYANALWVVPTLAGITVAVSQVGGNNRPLAVITGIVTLAGIVYGFYQLAGVLDVLGAEVTPEVADNIAELLAHSVAIGLYLTALASVGLIVFAVFEEDEEYEDEIAPASAPAIRTQSRPAATAHRESRPVKQPTLGVESFDLIDDSAQSGTAPDPAAQPWSRSAAISEEDRLRRARLKSARRLARSTDGTGSRSLLAVVGILAVVGGLAFWRSRGAAQRPVAVGTSPSTSASLPNPTAAASAAASRTRVESLLRSTAIGYYRAIQTRDIDKLVSYLFPQRLAELGGAEGAGLVLGEGLGPLSVRRFSIDSVHVVPVGDGSWMGAAFGTMDADRENQIDGSVRLIRVQGGLLAYSADDGASWRVAGVNKEEHVLLQSISSSAFSSLRVPTERVYVDENGQWVELEVP